MHSFKKEQLCYKGNFCIRITILRYVNICAPLHMTKSSGNYLCSQTNTAFSNLLLHKPGLWVCVFLNFRASFICKPSPSLSFSWNTDMKSEAILSCHFQTKVSPKCLRLVRFNQQMRLPLRATASFDRLSPWWQEDTKVPELERQRLKRTPTLSAPISAAIFTCHWRSPSTLSLLLPCSWKSGSKWSLIFSLPLFFLSLSHTWFVPFCFFILFFLFAHQHFLGLL